MISTFEYQPEPRPLSTRGMPLGRELMLPAAPHMGPESPYGLRYLSTPHSDTLDLTNMVYDPETQVYRDSSGRGIAQRLQDIDPGGGGCGGTDTQRTVDTWWTSYTYQTQIDDGQWQTDNFQDYAQDTLPD